MWIFICIAALVILILRVREIWVKKLLETVTIRNRGTKTERDLVLKLLKHGIPANTIFHDLYLKKQDGGFSQLDLVVATRVGVIVFEVKDYSGWIFGTSHQHQWTQVLAFGKQKYRFYNPIMQNSRHVINLKKQLKQFETIPFYSIVVFYGNCVLKNISFVPEGTFLVKSNNILEVFNKIMSNNELAGYTDKHEVVRILKEAVKNGEDKEIQTQHIRNVRELIEKERIYE